MKIQMLETKMGSEDGRFVSEYVQGMEYEVSKELGDIFLSNDFAIMVDETVENESKESAEGELEVPEDESKESAEGELEVPEDESKEAKKKAKKK